MYLQKNYFPFMDAKSIRNFRIWGLKRAHFWNLGDIANSNNGSLSLAQMFNVVGFIQSMGTHWWS